MNEKLTASLKQNITLSFGPPGKISDDDLLLELQKVIFRYDVSMLKSERRLDEALDLLLNIRERRREIKAPHVHGFVRLNETDCMIDTAEMILRASRARRESRLSHIREDYPARDDHNWLKWILIEEREGRAFISTEPVQTPLIQAPRYGQPVHPAT